MNAIATVPSVTDPRELALLKAVGLDRVSPEQRELALNIAKRYDLDLMLKHLVLIEGRPYITRDGLLHVAHRDGQLDGIVTTEPTVVDGFWRSTCSVYRKDMSHPFTYTGRYPTDSGNKKFAPEMAVKVGEVMALRRAFDVAAPVAEERWDTEVSIPDPTPRPSLAEKAAEKRASIAPERPQATETPEDEQSGVLAQPMTVDVSDAMPYVEETMTPEQVAQWDAETAEVKARLRDGGLTPAQFADKARASDVGRIAMAGALDVTPDRVAETIKRMDDAGRFRLAQSLGLVP